MHLITLLLAAASAVSSQPLVEPRSSDSFVVPLVYNSDFEPTALDLSVQTILKFGIYKNANQYPLLSQTLGLLGILNGTLSGLEGIIGDLVKREDSRAPPLNVRKRRRGHTVLANKRSLLDISLGLDLGLGSTPSATPAAGLDLGLGVQVTLGDGKTLVDSGWGGATTTRLVDSQNDNAWFAPIAFGTPGQTLTIFIDSGSADTVVYDASCSTCQLNNHTAFITSQSSTYVASNTSFSTQYGDGTTLTGKLGRDVVSLTSSLEATNQLIAVIDHRSGGSDTHAWDGIVGIGPDQLSFVPDNVTPLSNVIKQGKLKNPLVGIALVKQNKLTGNPGGGEYRWGEVNTDYVSGNIVYAPVTSSFFWGTDMTGIFVDGKQIMSSTDAPRALFDTGTTLIYTSDDAAKAIHAQMAGSSLDTQTGVWYVVCDSLLNVNVFFEIGGVHWGVPAGDISFQDSGRNDGLCVSGIQGGSETFTLLGDVFIKNHYLVLNYGSTSAYKLVVGLANRTDIPPIL